ENLQKFRYQPITTVYLRYPTPIRLKTPMIGIIHGIGHWIFDRFVAGQPDILSIVMTGFGPHSDLNHTTLVEKVASEISRLFPRLPAHLDYRVICEKRAAFSCDVGINDYRPLNTSPLSNLFLAGDYTQTGYPATLEGAIQSGVKAAQCIILSDSHSKDIHE